MVILDADFSEGDILTAGTIASTSGVNGITATINSNTVTKLIYVGSDLVEGSVASSTAETTIGSVTVPANTVTTGCLIVASVEGEGVAADSLIIFRLKTGVASSEVTRDEIQLHTIGDSDVGGAFAWYDTAATYSGDVSIIVTGQHNDNSASAVVKCGSIIVFGI